MTCALLEAARELATAVDRLSFGPPVTHIYNPLSYAWAGYRAFVTKFAVAPKRVLFLGMNPGPFGMAQTGIPFGDVVAVRQFLGIECKVGRPAREHRLRPVLGFECHRREISGSRLWGLFAARFGSAAEFFRDHFVANYCPLAFVEHSGRNRTPDHLPAREKDELFIVCDAHLRRVVAVLQPEWVIGVGQFAVDRAKAALATADLKIGRITHPSPASPAANRDWGTLATRQLTELGVWQA